MAFALIDSTSGNNVTPAIDTTGANLIVVSLHHTSGSGTLTDSKGNTWVEARLDTNLENAICRILYAFNPTVGSGHTFTSGADWMAISVGAFSGAATSPLDQGNGQTTGSSLDISVASGNVTPTEDDELLIAGLALAASATTSNITADAADGFTLLEAVNAVSGVSRGSAMAYQIQAAATLRNHGWSWTGSTQASTGLVSFKAAATGASVISTAAAALNPGNWVQLSAATDQATHTGTGATPYTLAMNEAAWDPIAKKAHHVCKQAGSPIEHRHIVYDEATHAWSTLDSSIADLEESGHGYDSLVVDPATSRLYWKNKDAHRVFYWADSPSYAWSSTNVTPTQWPNHGGGNITACPHWFWTGARDGGGNAGFWMTAQVSDSVSGTGDIDVDIVAWDVQANDWVATNQKIVDAIPSGGTTFQHWGSYSEIHNCAVIILGQGGHLDGSDAETDYRTWRINEDLTSTALPNPPTRVGYLVGSITCDPVTGDFVVLGDDGSFYRLDPTGSGTWSALTSAPAELWPLSTTATVCWPDEANGVTVWHNGLDGDMFIFKLANEGSSNYEVVANTWSVSATVATASLEYSAGGFDFILNCDIWGVGPTFANASRDYDLVGGGASTWTGSASFETATLDFVHTSGFTLEAAAFSVSATVATTELFHNLSAFAGGGGALPPRKKRSRRNNG